jgi:hypothetical protein
MRWWAAKSDVAAPEHGADARDLEVVIAGYGLALTVIGTVQLRRRDVSAGPGN